MAALSAGSDMSASAPSASAASASGSAGSDLVVRTAWWRAPGTMDSVLAWVKAHPPKGLSLTGAGASSGPSGITSRFYEFSLPPVPGVLLSRSLYVSVASDGPDRTALRVDSEVAWLPAKPAAEHIPASARLVTITAVPGASAGRVRHVHRPVTITSRAVVAKIATVVDDLPLMPPGVFSCPAGNGLGLRLAFRAVKGGPVLAQVTAEANGCGTVTLEVGGKHMPALWGGARMTQQVLRLAGIHWIGFP